VKINTHILKGFNSLLILSIFINVPGCNAPSNNSPKENIRIFKRLTASETGIDFVNRIKADMLSKNNVFDFDYFYNGAGVATVDINNDGLLDLFFTANQLPNRLYLNLGDLKFKDITEGSGINTGKGWSTGISFADINSDGWQDIYVSQGGPYHGAGSRNLLFINQTNNTFVESAIEYGLADESISSQSAFFDFDKDGDLDCFVMNENLLYGVEPRRFYELMGDNDELMHQSSGHLYLNEDGTFKDITIVSGMLGAFFGLGLIVSDVNDDNWLDIYVASDYYVPDALFINNQNGTFSNRITEYTKQVSFFGMGVDIADINDDTYSDIFVLDMASTDHYRSKTLMASMNVKAFDLLTKELGLHHQYMFNSLQLNSGSGFFRNVAHLTKLSKSDWSWSVLLNDFDNNTTNDVFITNGYRKYALNNDIRTKVTAARLKYSDSVPLKVKSEIYEQMPSEKLPNRMFRNKGNLEFEEVSNQWGLSDPSFSNGAAYADLDNDGDLDLVINNIDDEAFLYKNNTMENGLGNFLKVRFEDIISHTYSKVTISAGGGTQKKESNSVRGYLSAMDPSIHFGLGGAQRVDTLIVQWLSGKIEKMYNVEVNQEILLKAPNASNRNELKSHINQPLKEILNDSLGVDFYHKENTYNDFETETLLPYKQSSLGPYISVGDVNNDGLDDFYIGGALGQSGQLFVQTTNGSFSNATSEAMEIDFLCEDMESAFFDVDNDGDEDLYIVSGGYEFEPGNINYQDRLYINNGFGRYRKAIDSSLFAARYSGNSICIIDYDSDGIKDIAVGTRIIPGRYPVSDQSILYKNTGNELIDVTDEVIPDLNDFGMINKIIPTDFNTDGLTDLIVAGEWTGIGFFENTGGTFRNISSDIGLGTKKGWWFNVTELDINNDHLPDYLLGNLGLNSKYAASQNAPLKLYAKDFDVNGTWDIVLSNSYKGEYVPLRGRECSSSQMPFIAQDFPSYDLFAKATLEDIYGEKLDYAYQFEANDFSSIILLNKGKNKFEVKPMPIEAQMAPMLAAEAMDFNKDGYDDFITVGTIYHTEAETSRLDMGTGSIFLSNGVDGFEYDTDLNRKIRLEGNLKSIERIVINQVDHLIVGRNDDTPLFLKVNPLNE